MATRTLLQRLAGATCQASARGAAWSVEAGTRGRGSELVWGAPPRRWCHPSPACRGDGHPLGAAHTRGPQLPPAADALRASRAAIAQGHRRHSAAAAAACVVAYAALPRRLCFASEAGSEASGDRGGLGTNPLASLPLPLPLPRTVDAVPPSKPGPDLMKWVKLIAIGGLVLLLEAWAPCLGATMGLALAACTRPSAESLATFLEARRQRALIFALAQGPTANVARRLLAAVDPTNTVSGMHVLDCGACTLAHVVSVTEELTLIGAFGSWWVLTSASSTITVSLNGWWSATKTALGDAVAQAQNAARGGGWREALQGWATWRWGELSRKRGGGAGDGGGEDGHSAPGQHHNH